MKYAVQRGVRGPRIRFAKVGVDYIEWVRDVADATQVEDRGIAERHAEYLNGRFSSLRFSVVEVPGTVQ